MPQKKRPTDSRPSDKPLAQDSAGSRPTLHDVARRAGLSIGTVSRILNGGNKATWASTAAREATVRQIAKEVGYRPDYRARALRSGRSHVFGFVYGGRVPLLHGAYEQVAASVATVLAGRGFQMMFIPLPHDEEGDWPLDVLSHDRIDGCVGLHPLHDNVLEVIRSRGLSLVAINIDAPVPRVLPDDADATRQAVDYLVGLGHKRIAFCHPHFPDGGHFSLPLRRRVFLAEMRARGLAASCSVLEGSPSSLVERLKGPTDTRPTALLCYQAIFAQEAQHHMWAAGIKVPSQVSLMTFDDISSLQWLTPPMTAVQIPLPAMAERAAEMLLAHAEHGTTLLPKPVILPATLIVRASTAPVQRT